MLALTKPRDFATNSMCTYLGKELQNLWQEDVGEKKVGEARWSPEEPEGQEEEEEEEADKSAAAAAFLVREPAAMAKGEEAG